MNILGINSGHTATACISQNGDITACISEERITRNKNQIGFPAQSIKQVLALSHLTVSNLNQVVIATTNPFSHQTNLNQTLFVGNTSSYKINYESINQLTSQYLKTIQTNQIANQQLQIRGQAANRLKSSIKTKYAQLLSVPRSKISFVDHHLSHAYSTLGNLTRPPWLIFTLDGEGDELAATINVYDGESIKVLSRTSNAHSLGYLYLAFTKFLDMKPNEHEYKVMGLAPYGQAHNLAPVIAKIKQMISLNKHKDKFTSSFSMFDLDTAMTYLEANFRGQGYRFDMIAGAIQQVTEDLICEWVLSAIDKYHISQIALAGGVFLNVKANMRLAQQPQVKRLWIMPSAGDESLAIGACHFQYFQTTKKQPQPLNSLYLGPDFYSQVKLVVSGVRKKTIYQVTKKHHIEKEIARIISQGEIVARFKGRMEWGARALGNRSILARPDDPRIITPLNKAIKQRDFWMPFAPSIISPDMNRYLINPKHIQAPYMMLAFNTTPLGRRHLAAAIQPYDQTTRPQEVFKTWNPEYYQLISEFKKITGIGAILNTSFNLHGYPIVSSPEDALFVFENSGLQYLALENYLISKH